MSDLKIPDEWREDFIKTYIPLITGEQQNGIYKEKLENLTTEDVYKVLYFCEVSTRSEWEKGMINFEEDKKVLALRYIESRGKKVPRLALPNSVKNNSGNYFLNILIVVILLFIFVFIII